MESNLEGTPKNYPGVLWAGMLPGEHLVIIGTESDSLDARSRGLQLRDSILILSPGPRFTWAFLFRQPLEGTVAETVLKYGTGSLWIDACRIRAEGGSPSIRARKSNLRPNTRTAAESVALGRIERRGSLAVRQAEHPGEHIGRWPSNLLLVHRPECAPVGTKKIPANKPGKNPFGETTKNTYGKYNRRSLVGHGDENGQETIITWTCHPDCAVKLLDEQTAHLKGAGNTSDEVNCTTSNIVYSGAWKPLRRNPDLHGNDGGSAARFYPQFQSFGDALDWLMTLIGL